MEEKEIELFGSNTKNKELQQEEQEQQQQIQYRKQEYNCIRLLTLMLKKNLLLFQRQKCLSIFLFLSPLLICLLILLWQYLVDRFTGFLIIDPPIKDVLKQIPRCTSYNDNNCITIGYFILGQTQDWITNVMKRVAHTNHLKYDQDVKFIGNYDQPSQISEYLLSHMNLTQIAVVFCTDSWMLYDKQPEISIPCQFERLDKQVVFYTILYNYTLLYRSPYLSDMKIAYPKDAYASSLKISLDNAILREFSTIPKEDDEEFLYISQQEFPTIPTRFMQGIDIVGNYGAFYFFAPYLLNFLVLINEMLQEKGKKLRQGLTVMGLTHTIYWISWSITALILVIILTINLLICGLAFRMDFFLNTPNLILFILYVTFGFSISLVAFFIVVVCPDVKNGYTIAYGFILTAILMQMCFTQAGMSILFYRLDASSWVSIVRALMSLYPAFKYSLIFADISIKSCRHYSLEEGRWVEGDGFTYDDLFAVNSGKVQLDRNVQYQSPCAIDNYFHLLLACMFYIMLTYYFDHILESNRGKADSLLFCITKPFNKYFKSPPQPITDLQYQCHTNDSAQLEKERVIKNCTNNYVDGLRIIGLSKTYHKYPFNIISKDDVHALKDIYLEINSGECLALLGHNGAGKTTLIGLLTGMFKPSKGTAQIMNYDLNDMENIRAMLGVCPQFDILWNQLTAAEHLRMYATIKGLHKDQIENEIDLRLKEVELLHVKDQQIQTYSGGMKRRVSLAISAIGNPKIIIMDEPTTGMDPRARRQVWKMIKNMKQNRVVILTTHAMEEADVLADRIAVMAEGQLKAIGTSLFLKNNFSDGYRVNIITDQVDECLSKIKLLLNQFKLLDTSGGSILISIPFQYMQDLKALFEVFEKREQDLSEIQLQLRKLIKDWGLSHATLEEVFMKVTRCCE